MTAHFNPRHAGVRDPFSAYLFDESASHIVREVASEFGWPHERIFDGGLRAAAQGLAVAASPSILLVDISDAADPLVDIDALAEVVEPGTIVIACGPINDIQLYRGLVQSGMHDYLPKPLTRAALMEAFADAQNTLLNPRGGEGETERPHVQTAVIGVRGGVGATTVAASLAHSLGDAHARTTALLDLDVHFGTGALALDLEPGRGLTDAIENPSRIDGLFLERALVRANDKLSVLSAEAPINQPLTGDGSAFFQLQEELRQSFDCTVVDLPRHMLVQHPGLLHDAAVTVVVTDFTLAATRDTIRVLAWLKANAPRSTPLVVVNRVAPTGGEISRKDFEASIERAVDIVLPLDTKLSIQAAKLGKPLAEVAKSAKLGHALASIATRVLSASGDTEVAAKGDGKSLIGRLGDFKSLLAKKP
ncbi:pilus assembly protein CpaE [Sphingomonas naphthae]|uniref:Pilus assembly protein CpaE n=1 Tax=Sphingomonas naphthae TaxID=1813468 RepID=A0ABY7TFZ2_9SPHN|nr:pilus assembly protein CpaE [Sphingomonas naphthae]WCT72152.1 pilus assembly protein CpaE [Sphingomonas naphthae]